MGRKRIEIIIETERVILTSGSSRYDKPVHWCEHCAGQAGTPADGNTVRKQEQEDDGLTEIVRAQSGEQPGGYKCSCFDGE